LSATTNWRESVAEIHFRYQSVIKGALVAAKVAVNLSAFAVLVVHSSLRDAARLPIQTKSVPAMPHRKSGNRILAAEMKEYDA
jgi:hypothetical protein